MLKITSQNRTPAKRLLNTWYDSRAVRVMTLDQLTHKLQQAINEGLITEQGAARALNIAFERQQDNQQESGNGRSEKSDAKGDERDEGFKAQQGEGEQGDSEQGEQGEQDSKAPPQGEQESKQGEQGDEGEQDSEQGDEGDEQEGDEGDSEQESEQEQQQQEQEQQEKEQQEKEQEQARDGKLRHEMFAVILKYIAAGQHVAMVGPAGTGKSTIAQQVAEELGKTFTGTGAVMSKYDLVGYMDASGNYHETPLYDAATNGHLFNFDELDASAPDAVVAFNAITDEQRLVAFPCGMVEKHSDFVAVACMNTWGNGASADYVGRFKQDAAAMSRFVKVPVGYDERIERAVAGKDTDIAQRVWDLRAACAALSIRHVVSTRMIRQATAARKHKVTKAEIDRDVFFSGLDDAAITQVKSQMTRIARERKAAQGSA